MLWTRQHNFHYADQAARGQAALRRFLDLQGLSGIALAIEQGSWGQHPVRGKLRRVIGVH